MNILDMQQCAAVAGGDGGSVEQGVGTAVGKAMHGIGSKEGVIGGFISPLGAIIGAVIHFSNNH